MLDTNLLELLSCPLCGSELDATSESLTCTGCSRRYDIRAGIPRLVATDLADGQAATSERFGWQWQHFDELQPELEDEFLDWIRPLGRADFGGRTVLDGGCGFGRHTAIAAQFECARIVGMDLSAAVDASGRTIGPLPNAHVVQGDLLSPPFRQVEGAGPFDLVYCIGVLHHLPDPSAGFASLSRLVAPGGRLCIWVYGWEGNALVRLVVEPVRRRLTRLPPGRVRFVALPLAAALFAMIHTVYATPASGRLPLGSYLHTLRRFTFRHVYTIVFDQLVAPTTAYIRRAEVERWFADAGFDDVIVSRRNGNSWRGLGRKPV